MRECIISRTPQSDRKEAKMLCIKAARLRRESKLLMVLNKLFELQTSGKFTLIGEGPRSFDLRDRPNTSWMTYSRQLRKYVVLNGPPAQARDNLPMVSVVIDQLTLVFDERIPWHGSKLCAVLVDPALHQTAYAEPEWYTRPPRTVLLRDLTEKVVPHWIWDYMLRFDEQLREEGFIFMGNYSDEQLSKIACDELKLIAAMALAK